MATVTVSICRHELDANQAKVGVDYTLTLEAVRSAESQNLDSALFAREVFERTNATEIREYYTK